MFFIATGSILYFNNLSAISDSKDDYEILRKMGYTDRTVKKIIKKQTISFFSIPFLFGLVDCVFATLVYRTALMQNILKETLTQDNGIIILSVSDNGTVDADVLSSADRLKHRGLAMITERVNDMDGSVTISNNHPHGICVQTILPMKGDVSYQHFVSR